jgi:Ca2+-binding RTX toxin-like protein
VVTGINNADQVVGFYIDANGVQHGFETSFIPKSVAENAPTVLNSLSVVDPAANGDSIQVTLGVGHGSLAMNDSSLVSSSFAGGVVLTGSVEAIDAELAKGVVYTPNQGFNGADTLTVTANDQGHNSSGQPASDTQTLNFNVVNPVIGTTGNDVLTGTGANDLFTGGAGQNQFAFNASLGNTGHDIISDFKQGDKIELDYQTAPFSAGDPGGFANWLANHAAATDGGDVLIDLNVDGLHPNVDTILLKHYSIANLQASDFNFSAGHS